MARALVEQVQTRVVAEKILRAAAGNTNQLGVAVVGKTVV